MKTPEIFTFGCRLNTYESEIIRKLVNNANLQNTLVINTCAVTAEAERQARQSIRKARRKYPQATIVVTGCAAQINPQQFAEMDEVNLVIGNEEKLQPHTWKQIKKGDQTGSNMRVNDIMSVQQTAGHFIDGFYGRSRGFVQIQQGCDHRCTFCIIPFGRGPSRSVPVGTIIRQGQRLVDQGYMEIVLTGVDLTDFGKTLPGKPSLGNLVARLLKNIPSLPRLRLSSLDPIEIDDELYRLISSQKRLLPYFHLSLQSGDNMILKRMKRRHSREDSIEICKKIRRERPDATFGADIIAGFPTETEEMFNNTISLIEACDLTHLHVFPYSERVGTPAARMPKVPIEIRRQRASILREVGKRRLQTSMKKRIGKEAIVVVEKNNFGRCESYFNVKLNRNFKSGTLVPCLITDIDDEFLYADCA